MPQNNLLQSQILQVYTQVKYGMEEYKVLIYSVSNYNFMDFLSVVFPHALSERPRCFLPMATHQQQRPNYTPVNSSGMQSFSLSLQRLNTQNPGKEYSWIMDANLLSPLCLSSAELATSEAVNTYVLSLESAHIILHTRRNQLCCRRKYHFYNNFSQWNCALNQTSKY